MMVRTYIGLFVVYHKKHTMPTCAQNRKAAKGLHCLMSTQMAGTPFWQLPAYCLHCFGKPVAGDCIMSLLFFSRKQQINFLARTCMGSTLQKVKTRVLHLFVCQSQICAEICAKYLRLVCHQNFSSQISDWRTNKRDTVDLYAVQSVDPMQVCLFSAEMNCSVALCCIMPA